MHCPVSCRTSRSSPRLSPITIAGRSDHSLSPCMPTMPTVKWHCGQGAEEEALAVSQYLLLTAESHPLLTECASDTTLQDTLLLGRVLPS